MNNEDTAAASPVREALSPRLLVRGLILLALPLALLAIGLSVWAGKMFGVPGVQAALLAALVCYTAGALAILCSWLFQAGQSVAGLLGGMLFRLGLPLAAGMVFSQSRLADVYAVEMLVACYLVMLVTETLLSLQFVSPAPKAAKTSQA